MPERPHRSPAILVPRPAERRDHVLAIAKTADISWATTPQGRTAVLNCASAESTFRQAAWFCLAGPSHNCHDNTRKRPCGGSRREITGVMTDFNPKTTERTERTSLRIARTSLRIAKISLRNAKTSPRIARTNWRIAKRSVRVRGTSEQVGSTSGHGRGRMIHV